MSDTVTQVVDGGLRASVPVGVSAASYLGFTLEEWVYLFTIAYTGLQGAYLVYRWRRSHKKDKEAKNGKQDNRK